MTKKAAPAAVFQEYLIQPLQAFFRTQAIGGVLLLTASVAAIVCANTGLAPLYHRLWETPLRVGLGGFMVDKTLHHWVDDGLMAIYFFLVGLEIKREVLAGELGVPKKAVLPITAAVGGMLAPALIYAVINAGGEGLHGWGIPMATDIAFSLGVLQLLKGRAPIGLLVFLTALAIADDLGAVLVIALFYGGRIAVEPLIIGGLILAVSVTLNRAGVRKTLLYSLLGVALWLAFLNSGVHATIAGILLAFTIPTRTTLTAGQFQQRVGELMRRFAAGDSGRSALERDETQQALIRQVGMAALAVEAPLQRIEHNLHPWVTFAIIPLFAFANAGIDISSRALGAALIHPVTLGVVVGLVLGKQLGVMLCSWLPVRLGWAELPAGVTWKHLYGVSWLAGIGFTMSIFIANLAFEEPHLVEQAKIGILLASLIAGAVGYGLLGGWAGVEKCSKGTSRSGGERSSSHR
ncbi:MAG TPA: Na+/H+ antiporter NhaA [Nitrospiria bacterium]|nr:Na+/H+ antiporter NhaA [Nitrospiria bacterium]